jgi:hypothetical protein
MQKHIIMTAVALIAALSVAPRTVAGQEADTLKVGQTAPDFIIPSTVGIPEGSGTVGIRAITGQGKAVVLAFFPRAFTGG